MSRFWASCSSWADVSRSVPTDTASLLLRARRAAIVNTATRWGAIFSSSPTASRAISFSPSISATSARSSRISILWSGDSEYVSARLRTARASRSLSSPSSLARTRARRMEASTRSAETIFRHRTSSSEARERSFPSKAASARQRITSGRSGTNRSASSRSATISVFRPRSLLAPARFTSQPTCSLARSVSFTNSQACVSPASASAANLCVSASVNASERIVGRRSMARVRRMEPYRPSRFGCPGSAVAASTATRTQCSAFSVSPRLLYTIARFIRTSGA